MDRKEIAAITYRVLQMRKRRKKLLEAKATNTSISGLERTTGRKLGQL